MVRVFFCVFLLVAIIVPRAGGGLLYHGAGLGGAHCDDADAKGLADDTSLADVCLTICGRNLIAVVAWHELAHIKAGLSCCRR